MNLRELVQNKLAEARGDVPPDIAVELSTDLSSMLGTILDHEAELRQQAYTVLVLAMSDPDVSHAKAEALMKASDEYKKYKQANALYIAALETIRSLRIKARRAEQELNENIV